MNHNESKLQQECIQIFRLKYPKLARVLIAVPNAARRSPRLGKILKDEGMIKGASDLILLVPSNGSGSLCIEMKYQDGRQSESQKTFAVDVVRAGNRYVICRSVYEFLTEIEKYLQKSE